MEQVEADVRDGVSEAVLLDHAAFLSQPEPQRGSPKHLGEPRGVLASDDPMNVPREEVH